MGHPASVLTHMPQLITFLRRSTVVGSLAMAMAMHGLEPAEAGYTDSASLGASTPWAT